MLRLRRGARRQPDHRLSSERFRREPDAILTDESLASDDLRRRLLLASVRGGGRLRLSERAALDLGLGLGLVSALAHHEQSDGSVGVDSEGALLGEGLATLVLQSQPRLWWFVGGSLAGVVPAESTDPDDEEAATALPAAYPSVLVSLQVGAAYGWGASR